ncbi:LysR family transcriptional regulator [Phreatobacter sp. AB_2022a]|uniref:LysR family transcriptional regulator n=1 Tax=Phreatobacter sp. AB_2022a TaxID=3003134 RepID=UPI0022873198|nr:LysR family transcriptional regulator [Phreatobacter sp. AB_2022a]MCZ0737509.1 LysR family transcriptional regulator [Phreatobacter sp. AB_2022a]
MDHETFRLAVALAETGDLGKAGTAAGGLGKRTVTARIAQLERRVGALLFDHSGRVVTATPAGEAFVAEARLALAAGERAERLARAVATRPAAVAIGVASGALFGPARSLVEDPAWAEAGLRPQFHDMSGPDQARALAAGRLVLGFLTPPVAATPRLDHVVVARSAWSAVVPAAEAHLRRSASLPGLARKPLVMLAQEEAPLAHDGLVAALRATGTEPYLAQAARTWPSVIALVALGLGSALVPSDIAKAVAVEGAAVLPLTEASGLQPWITVCAFLPQPPGSRDAEAVALVKRRFSS